MSKPGLFGILLQIAQATDFETAEKIAMRFGGREISVPANPHAGSASTFVQLIGVDNAAKIAQTIGTGKFDVPQAGFVGTTAKRRHARDLIAEGRPSSEVVEQTGYTSRHLRRLKNTETPTLPLFPDE